MVSNGMGSIRRIWPVAGVVLVGAMLSLSICINACTDIAPVSNDCPHHQENSDCCKHPSGDSVALGWNPQKQHSHFAATGSVDSMELPIAFFAPTAMDRVSLDSLPRYHDSSGPAGLRIFSLRI
jgi:hypothetical protein